MTWRQIKCLFTSLGLTQSVMIQVLASAYYKLGSLFDEYDKGFPIRQFACFILYYHRTS